MKGLFHYTDGASLAVFRIFFGFIMCIEMLRYFDHDWIGNYWANTSMNIGYWPFHTLEPLEGNGMYWLLMVLTVLSLFIMLGLFYRIAMPLFFLGFTYSFLLEQGRYLNHFYLIVLVSFAMIFIPAHKTWSLDNLWFNSSIKRGLQPLWALWTVRFLVAIPLFFGGIAKLNADWLAGKPLNIWLLDSLDFPFIGHLFTENWMVLAVSYLGLIFDLFIVPLLLFKRTRIWAFGFCLLFHTMNSELFSIGIFPWFMMGATTLFFYPSWPRYLRAGLTNSSVRFPEPSQGKDQNTLSTTQQMLKWGLILFAAFMMLLPLRHYLLPGNANWTEGGHKYAWHMKLRTKKAIGYVEVKDNNGAFTHKVDPYKYMPEWQARKVLARPSMLWIFASKIKKEYEKEGHNVGVYGHIDASLNGRPYQKFIDDKKDLTQVPHPFWGVSKWVLPLHK